VTLKVIHQLHAFSNAICRTFVQHFTRFQLTVSSHGFSALPSFKFVHNQFLLQSFVVKPQTTQLLISLLYLNR